MSLFNEFRSEPPDYYGDLGIFPSACRREIKQAFAKLAKIVHPDKRAPGQTVDAHEFRKIREAYDNLFDETKRAAYDKQRAEYRTWKQAYDHRQEQKRGEEQQQAACAACAAWQRAEQERRARQAEIFRWGWEWAKFERRLKEEEIARRHQEQVRAEWERRKREAEATRKTREWKRAEWETPPPELAAQFAKKNQEQKRAAKEEQRRESEEQARMAEERSRQAAQMGREWQEEQATRQEEQQGRGKEEVQIAEEQGETAAQTGPQWQEQAAARGRPCMEKEQEAERKVREAAARDHFQRQQRAEARLEAARIQEMRKAANNRAAHGMQPWGAP
ncbi:hypothetical protein OQA88_12499 [Cercophora sp. LCS_1]